MIALKKLRLPRFGLVQVDKYIHPSVFLLFDCDKNVAIGLGYALSLAAGAFYGYPTVTNL